MAHYAGDMGKGLCILSGAEEQADYCDREVVEETFFEADGKTDPMDDRYGNLVVCHGVLAWIGTAYHWRQCMVLGNPCVGGSVFAGRKETYSVDEDSYREFQLAFIPKHQDLFLIRCGSTSVFCKRTQRGLQPL